MFIMPKVQDPEVIQRKKTDETIKKLITYMQKSWKVKVDPTQAERELVYRTINTVSTKKPDNWRELIEQREQIAVQTGFFCGFDGPYSPLINLELDTPMLVFNNLPPDLRITAVKWLRDRAREEEEIRRKNAYLPKLPRNRIKRPNFARGRLLKDPGGLGVLDELVKVAEEFQRLTKGGASYAKVLSDYAKKKDNENENINSGFGVVRVGFKYGFTALQTPDEDESVIQTKSTNNRLDRTVTPSKSDRRGLFSNRTKTSKFK